MMPRLCNYVQPLLLCVSYLTDGLDAGPVWLPLPGLLLYHTMWVEGISSAVDLIGGKGLVEARPSLTPSLGQLHAHMHTDVQRPVEQHGAHHRACILTPFFGHWDSNLWRRRRASSQASSSRSTRAAPASTAPSSPVYSSSPSTLTDLTRKRRADAARHDRQRRVDGGYRR